jgi:hypothetical protein
MSDALAHLGTAAIGYAWATHILLALITQVIAMVVAYLVERPGTA